MTDWRTAGLSEIDQVMCAHAERLALEPASITPADLDALRARGLTDRMILDMNLVCAAFAFFVRMADGLGAQLEPEMENPPEAYR
ncbi:MAG: peroxidase [Planctomycetota bacterium]